MLEKLIENWLDKTDERSLQKVLCYILSAQGHTVIHITRHCGMEMGKDIITVAPDGTPCAYQLKAGGKITLRKWNAEISNQTMNLVSGQIVHPSLLNPGHHRSYLVTNGEIEEEAARAIDDRNRMWENRELPHFRLQTIVRGQLLRWAVELGTELWPTDLNDVNTLLSMFLEDGKGVLPKAKLASLFESVFSLQVSKGGKKPTSAQCKRVISSGAVLCAIAGSSFSNMDNYTAEVEAWVLYVSYMFALVERWELPLSLYENELEIAKQGVFSSLGNLCDEIGEREYFVEGNPLADSYVYRVRMTWLLAFMGIYGLWRRSEGQEDETDKNIREFCRRHRTKLFLWGEAAIPQFLAFLWYFRKIDGTRESDDRLGVLISTICHLNRPRSKELGLANPYYQAEDILPHILGVADQPLEDSFQGRSYALEGLLHLYVRRNWKQSVKLMWPDVTRIGFVTFEPESTWDFYRWRNKERGIERTVYPKHTQRWEDLKRYALESEGENVPQTIRGHLLLSILFLCVYPHRISASLLRWIDAGVQTTIQ